MAKKYCIACGMKVESWNSMKELLQVTRHKELEPVEFEDGLYCKTCANKKRTTAYKQEETKWIKNKKN